MAKWVSFLLILLCIVLKAMFVVLGDEKLDKTTLPDDSCGFGRRGCGGWFGRGCCGGLGSEGGRDGSTGGGRGGGGGYSGHHYYDLNLFISFILWIKLKFKNVKITIKIFYTIYSHKTLS
jgi:hypothetical protein